MQRIQTLLFQLDLAMLEFWIFLLAIPIILLLISLAPSVVSLFEKRHVRNLAIKMEGKFLSANDPGPHPYMDAVNEQAGQIGFEFGGIFVRATKGAAKFRAAVWRSPERDILAHVSIVQAGPLRQKITRLVTQVGNRYLVTTDDFSEDDISGLLDHEVRKNAHFSELLNRHEDRLARVSDQVVHFLAENMAEDLDAIQIERAQRMVELGYAKFLDDDRSVWSYTVKGAVHLYFRSYLKQLLGGLVNSHRQWRRRPGS